MTENKSKYPCTNCGVECICEAKEKYIMCIAWRKWIREQWEEIRKKFGAECVDSAQKGDDLNE